MRKKVALLIVFTMLVTMLMPLNVFAEKEKSLEEIIKIAKSVFVIPDSYSEFNYNVSTEMNNKKVWYLNWNSKDGMDGGVSLSIDEKGKIISYNSYKPSDYTQRKFSKLSKQEAISKAEAFIKKINPDIMGSIQYNENPQISYMEPFFYLNFTRVVNGIPFYNNFVNVEVNKETGEVRGYNTNWTEDLVFPSKDKVIPVEQAQKAYKEKLGLRLVYMNSYDGKKMKVFAVYVPKFGEGEFIDALTGEKISLQPGFYGPYYGFGGMGDIRVTAAKAANESKAESANVVLSPEEQNAVEKVSKLITKDEAEKKIRESKYLGLTSDFKLNSANLSREWNSPDDFSWHLYFDCPPSGDNKDYKSVSARVNAVTGELRGFYVGYPITATEGKMDEAASKKAAEEFLKEIQPAKYAETEFDDTMKTYYPMAEAGKKPTQYNFRYIRKVNGVYFPGNSLNVNFDAVNGKILSFDMAWFSAEFPAVDKAMSLDSVYEKMFKDVGMELQYNMKYPDEYYYKGMPGGTVKPDIKLVYAPKKNKPVLFDANTGVILNYDGQPYKETRPVVYSDISGNFAEKQILALAEHGIALEGGQFKPDSNITQKDLLYLIAKSMNYNTYDPYVTKDEKSETEKIYAFLTREGVVKQGEKSPDALVSKEEGIKFIIRALKYDKVADIKGIFVCTFKDKNKINPDLIGHVSIAQGLKIVSGSNGYLNPKATLTRAEAAVMIYNYMQ